MLCLKHSLRSQPQMTATYHVPQLPWLQELSLTAIKAIHQLQYSQRVIESQLQSDDTHMKLPPLQLPAFPYAECDKIYFILDQALSSDSALQPNDVLHLLLHDLPYLVTISTYLSAHHTWPLFACSQQYIRVVYHIYQHLHHLYLSALESSDSTHKQVVRISYRWIVQLWLQLMQTSDIADVQCEKLQQLGGDRLHALIQSRVASTVSKSLAELPTIVPAAVAPVSEVIARIREVVRAVQHEAESSRENEKENMNHNATTSLFKRRRIQTAVNGDERDKEDGVSGTETYHDLSVPIILHISHLLSLPVASQLAATLRVAELFITVSCTAEEQGSNITPLLQAIVDSTIANNQQLWKRLAVSTQLRVLSTFPDVFMAVMLDTVASLLHKHLVADNAVFATAFEPLLHLQHQAASKQERAVRVRYTASLLRMSLEVLGFTLVETSNATLLHIYQWINKQLQMQLSSATAFALPANGQFAIAVSCAICASHVPAFVSEFASVTTELHKLTDAAQRLDHLRRTIWLPMAANCQWVAYSAVRLTAGQHTGDSVTDVWCRALLTFIAPEVIAHSSSEQADSHANSCVQLMLAVRASLASNPSIAVLILLVEPHTRLLPVAVIRLLLCYLLPALFTSTTQGTFCPSLVDWMLTSMAPVSTGTGNLQEDKTAVVTTTIADGAADAISSSDLFALLMRVTDGWLDCVSSVRSELSLSYRQQGSRGYAFALRQLHTSVSGEQGQQLRRTMDKLKEIGAA